MSISIALCTYNGARFLREQLDSYCLQTLPPDELVVCDDRSNDETGEVVRSFAESAPFPVQFHVNEVNLGFAENFGRAVSLCSGDLIALSDQDDVWKPERLARAAARFDADTDLGLTCSDAEVADGQLRPTGRSLLESIRLSDKERAFIAQGGALQMLLRRNFAMGASTTLRASLRSVLLPIPEGWSHDWWFALAASLHSGVALIEAPLLLYRQHGGNQVGAPKDYGLGDLVRGSTRARGGEFIRQQRQWHAALRRIEEFGGIEGTRLSKDDMRDVERMLAHLRVRSALPSTRFRRISPVVGEIVRGNYHRYAAGLGSAARDLLVTT